MRSLEEPDVVQQPPFLAGTPATALAVLTAVLFVAIVAHAVAGVPERVSLLVAIAAGHGMLLVTAVGWASADAGRLAAAPSRRAWLVLLALLAAGAFTSATAPWGATAYLAIPLWALRLRNRGGLALTLPRPSMLLAGAAVGVAVGVHLLATASRTFGYHIGADAAAPVLGAVGYDLGLNTLTAECFFRGALLLRLYRRVPWRGAVGLSTVAYVTRYLVDPLLPQSADAVLGAIFYLAALGVVNCWLLRWSGSLLPGYIAAGVFFAFYRLLSRG
jgi:CAAX prenyl protease-like protein